jgi:hypothetical protein
VTCEICATTNFSIVIVNWYFNLRSSHYRHVGITDIRMYECGVTSNVMMLKPNFKIIFLEVIKWQTHGITDMKTERTAC